MRWPDIFFKPRKSKPLPEIVTVPPKAAEPVKPASEKTEAERAEAEALYEVYAVALGMI